MWLIELLEPFAEWIAHRVSSAVMRVKAWRAYRRRYTVAERREHSRQLKARDPRGPFQL